MSAGAKGLKVEEGLFRVPGTLDLAHGGRLEAPQLAWSSRGKGSAVVVLGGISAGADLSAWWRDFVGAGKALDTGRHRILGYDYIGGAGRSTGPRPWGSEGPLLRIDARDQARAIAAHLDELGLERLRAVVGASYGGNVALAFAELYPERVERVVALCAAHRPHPMATALRTIQRRIVRLGLGRGALTEALSIARGLGMATYRSVDEFELRFRHEARMEAEGPRFPVEDYLEARGRSFVERFDADALLCLSTAIDLVDVDPGALRTPLTLVSIASDQLVPVWLVEELERLAASSCRHHRIESLYGHDGFLKEEDTLRPLLRRELAGEEVAP